MDNFYKRITISVRKEDVEEWDFFLKNIKTDESFKKLKSKFSTIGPSVVLMHFVKSYNDAVRSIILNQEEENVKAS